MSEKQKINWINILLICLIILFIVVTIVYISNSSIDTSGNTENNVSNYISSDDIINEEKTDSELTFEELDFNSEEVKRFNPFTGAFPTESLAYITKLRNIDKKDFDNDFILKYSFAKVTKEDWSESYLAEGKTLSISASVLDNYIAQLFGNIKYNKNNFNNNDVKYDNNISGMYNVEYNEEEDKYNIDINSGDVDESVIEYLYQQAKKYSDRIEIIIHPIYIRNCGEVQDEDGNYTFSYIAYKHYNFETNAFISRLTDTMNNIWQEDEEGNIEYNKLIQGIQEKDLETFVLTYKLNKDTNDYEFYSLTSK